MIFSFGLCARYHYCFFKGPPYLEIMQPLRNSLAEPTHSLAILHNYEVTGPYARDFQPLVVTLPSMYAGATAVWQIDQAGVYHGIEFNLGDLVQLIDVSSEALCVLGCAVCPAFDRVVNR